MEKTIPGMSVPNAWLHWNSKKTDTIEFLTEARSLGIQVPISLSALSLMSWNDEVYCIHKKQKESSGSVFCKFPLTNISGLTEDAMAAVVEQLRVKEVKAAGGFIERLSGEYMELATWTVNATMQDIHAVLKSVKNEFVIGSLTAGCNPDEFSVLEVPWARLAQIAHAPGFRQFDGRRFTADAAAYRNTSTYQSTFQVRLEGGYEAAPGVTGAESGNVQAVNHYGEWLELGQLELAL